MNYYAYILQSLKDNKYYFGVTNNLERRLKEHNSRFSKSTKSQRPFMLVYSEKFVNIKDAYKREKYFKSLKSRKFIKNIIDNSNLPG
ncbi:hypothetical protein A3F08_03660 [Candidatus Berkelbacteria bacterium RIFCSPHIGHO2_12_FULL_36_9]|uniref:GIY-YIG domain-containing protein n=1 Tax=Candidatus Berkelbacteria bacterium RIFCSPHIGHO2_12_FULL_36_9 TaxID=1797469 RepID=A0A1F5EII7_9BACT|nr:MAG: hypothetical protein A3F08_03660 [Candidatus Berkelbacteria bacterium RIFCSPHIGHO2_12_FULL_36_9]